jgi:Secretion system C-terminal sorting domain
MKKNILLVCLGLFTYSHVRAQVDTNAWSPRGATWLYKTIAQVGLSYLKIVYQRDTFLLGKNVKEMVVARINYVGIAPNWVRGNENFVFNTYMYSAHDSVFWLHNNQFQLLYVFNASIGTSWEIQPNNIFTCVNQAVATTNLITVRNVQQMLIANRLFTVIDANPQRSWTIGTRILKNIGSMQNPFPIPSNSNCPLPDGNAGVPESLMCYQDAIRGILDFGNAGNCASLITNNEDVHSYKNARFAIFPNPLTSILNLTNPDFIPIKQLSITDIVGNQQLIMNYRNEDRVNIESLADGMYILTIHTLNQGNYSIKFIKTH